VAAKLTLANSITAYLHDKRRGHRKKSKGPKGEALALPTGKSSDLRNPTRPGEREKKKKRTLLRRCVVLLETGPHTSGSGYILKLGERKEKKEGKLEARRNSKGAANT